MHRKHLLFCCLVFGLLFAGAACGSAVIPTPTDTPEPTHTPKPTNTAMPTATDTPDPSPTVRPSPTCTPTPEPTPTPEKTSVPLGETGEMVDPNTGIETAVTVLEVRRGEEAMSLFEDYRKPDLHEQQDLLSVRVRVEYVSGPENELKSFGSLSFWAMYPDGAWADPAGFYGYKGDEGEIHFESYPGGSGEGWSTWAIRKGGPMPVLLYQYMLAGVVDAAGLVLDPLVLELE